MKCAYCGASCERFPVAHYAKCEACHARDARPAEPVTVPMFVGGCTTAFFMGAVLYLWGPEVVACACVGLGMLAATVLFVASELYDDEGGDDGDRHA